MKIFCTRIIYLLLEGHLAQVENGGGQLEGVLLLSQGEAQGVEGLVSELQLLSVVNGVHLDFPLGAEEVVVGVGAHLDELLQPGHGPLLHQLEEDVVAPLVGLLVGHTGLLQQVDVNEATSKLAHVVEVDTDELSLEGKCYSKDRLNIK